MNARVEALVTPEVLAWARDTAGFDVDDVVEELKRKTVTSKTIKAWEEGRKRPTYAQLTRLAEIYRRPIAVFYFPLPPKEDSPTEKLRSLPEADVQNLPPRIRFLIREASVRQINLQDLHGENAPIDISHLKIQIKDINQRDPKALAKKMRDIIGISLKEQFQWPEYDDAFKFWRKALEDQGIWVFKEAFGDNDYCGFYLHDENFPIIYLNNSMSFSRQIFSLFHELGHFLLAKGGIDFRKNVEHRFPGEYREEEVFCNSFAGSFLVPDTDMLLPNDPNDDKEISSCANKYKVSREVILRKLLDKNLITGQFYYKKIDEWYESWTKRNTGSKGGGNYYYNQVAYLGEKYLTLSFGEYYRQRISDYQLSDYLGVKVNLLPTLEGYMLGMVE